MRFVIPKPTKNLYGHPDLERAWNMLPGGHTALHKRSGERWQYLGTWFVQEKPNSGNGYSSCTYHWEHQFRHRWHPYTGERMYFKIVAGKWTSIWLSLDYLFWLFVFSHVSRCFRLISASLRCSALKTAISSSINRKHIKSR